MGSCGLAVEVWVVDRMVKRRERSVGGCESSMIEECVAMKRGMQSELLI